MQLTNRFTMPARVDEVWAAFNRPERVAPCLPGGTLDSVSGDDFTGSIKIKFGPILLLYNGSGRFVERDYAEHRLLLEARGRDRRGQGGATVSLTARLEPLGRGTELQVETDLTLTGRPAQFGQALIKEAVDRVLERFVRCVAEQLTAREPAETIPATVAATAIDAEQAEAGQLDREPVADTPVGHGPAEDELIEVSSTVPDPAMETPEAPAEDEPVIDPRGDDADFATVPSLAVDPLIAEPEVDAEPEPIPSTITGPTEPEPGAAQGDVTATTGEFRTPNNEPRPGSAMAPISHALPDRRRIPANLRRYAPAASAVVAAGVAVVVWAIGRRRR